jgi:uncharacterized protein (TIGR02246 family)
VTIEHQAVASALVEGIASAWNRADGAAYGDNYWPDADLVGFDGAVFDGRPAIISNHIEMWSGSLKGSQIEGTVRRVRPVGSGALVVDVDLQNRAGSLPGKTARVKCVLEQRDGIWKVMSTQNTLV